MIKDLSVSYIIYALQNSVESFEELALAVFNYQYTHNKVYQKYCNLINKTSANRIDDIPFLPIEFFKNHRITCFEEKEEITFLSSGTTGMIQSKHHVKYLNDYIDSFKASWLHFFKDFSRYQFIPLLPAYADREGSSLILMVQELMKLSGQTDHTFYLNEYDKVESAYHLALNNEKNPIIFGVTFALLELVSRKFSFPEAIIIETGGMKGRGKELSREELHTELSKLNPAQILSEYGMTELMSQAYAMDGKNFSCPPWLKVLGRETDDPFAHNSHKTLNAIDIIDLCNLHSCSFLQTQDIGRFNHQNQQFQVLGRMAQSELRGCNLLAL